MTRRSLREKTIFVLLAAPNIALILAFTYRPLLMNMYYSTLDWTLGSDYARSVGLGNYMEFFTKPESMQVLRTTLIFTVATVGGSILLGLALSTVLNRQLVGRGFARATVFAPYVLSGVGVGLVWMFIFDPTSGVLSALLRRGGLPVPQWFLQPDLSLAMVIIVYVWKNLGYCAVIYLAALQAIPRDLLEAAAIDGAGRWQVFSRIVWPLLSPTSFFLLMTMLLSSLQAFDLIRIMTPLGNGTTTLMYAAYLQAFGGYNRAGYSAAISTILFVILIVVTIVQLRVIERKVHYA
ncbi:sugar ABC transporter permease [Brooklawnia propionicigenes]|jgi:sn-glycerol 3-phosphate transport system permease protein|uniref:Sugar ABC transporter permease n=1 Tax=Brooklawnia propionicigenes TaxID=3041175 RepID=A0AAN0KD94_9ACTN|nr:sugar ABC transporter permease [Brooklawnia sp. SH051]BEH03200.1 sugar ABC transporter permease [Brooklawnia sp. SH051]